VRLDLAGDGLGGPGVRVWPVEPLPDEAQLVYAARGLAQRESGGVESAA
jgi:hypothetical protein